MPLTSLIVLFVFLHQLPLMLTLCALPDAVCLLWQCSIKETNCSIRCIVFCHQANHTGLLMHIVLLWFGPKIYGNHALVAYHSTYFPSLRCVHTEKHSQEVTSGNRAARNNNFFNQSISCFIHKMSEMFFAFRVKRDIIRLLVWFCVIWYEETFSESLQLIFCSLSGVNLFFIRVISTSCCVCGEMMKSNVTWGFNDEVRIKYQLKHLHVRSNLISWNRDTERRSLCSVYIQFVKCNLLFLCSDSSQWNYWKCY